MSLNTLLKTVLRRERAATRASHDRERLVYVMHHYSADGSSHFSHVLPLIRELGQEGVEVLLLIESAATAPPDLGPNVQVHFMPSGASGYRRFLWVIANVRRAAASGHRAFFVRISSPTAIATMFALLGTPGKLFFWQSGTTIEFDRQRQLSWAKIKWYVKSFLPARFVWRFCDVFVTGPSVMVDYYATVGGVARSKIRLLHNDVQLERFQMSPSERMHVRRRVRSHQGLSDDAISILFVHRLSPVRRTLDYLPGAILNLRQSGLLEAAHFVIAGGGPDLSALESACRDADLVQHVSFIGEAPNAGIEDLYVGADIFIQPSHAEGFPRVMLEAMAAGLPIVTTDAGGSSEILGDAQQAFVANRDDPAAFAQALSRLVRSGELRAELSRENLDVVQGFDTPSVAKMYRRVLLNAE